MGRRTLLFEEALFQDRRTCKLDSDTVTLLYKGIKINGQFSAKDRNALPLTTVLTLSLIPINF